MTDYKDHPPSVSEIKSDRSRNAKDWTPRDALISALRDLDAGKIKPNVLIIGCAEILETGGVDPTFYLSAPNVLLALGMIERTKEELIHSKTIVSE